MRVTYLFILLIVCIIMCVGVGVFANINKYCKFVLCIVIVGIFLLGSSIINLNSLSSKDQKKLNKVIETCGDSYIKSKGNKIYVRVNDGWLDLDKVSILGTFTKDCVIEYDGREIKLSESGLKSTIKTLEYVGLLKNK